MPEAAAPTTRRDQLAAALETVEQPETPELQTNVIPDEKGDVRVGETEAQRTERLRDATGKFATPDKAVVKQDAKPAEAAAPAAVRPPKPSSWKKDYDSHWETLDPKLAEYITQRESEYARGVSTYKTEADRARELIEATTPFQAMMQQQGIQPAQLVRNLGVAHQRLSQGSPQEKLQMFAKLAQDYQVPLQLLFDPQYQQQAAQQFAQFQQAPQPQDVSAIVRAELETHQSQQQVQAFLADVPEKYPHYEQVKDDMIGLLRSGAAQDLASAYSKAIRLNDDIWQAEQDRKHREAEAERQRQQAEAAAKARSKVISVRSATPTGTAIA